MKRILAQLLVAVGVAGFAAPIYADEPGIVGNWRTANGSHVTVSKCSAGFCGRLIKISIKPSIYNKYKSEIDAIGMQNIPDQFNKDPAKRSRQLRGLQILTLSQSDIGQFEGAIYNAEDGNTYSGRLAVKSKSVVTLTGCTFFDMLCQSENWQRVQ